MRRSEITPELIELSKKATKLGFPQDVEKGDWYEIGGQPVLCNYSKGTLRAFNPKEHSLILSFSRCLEWLRERGWCPALHDFTMGDKGDYPCQVVVIHREFQAINTKAKTHHEAIAKAVVKILEEKEDG